MIYRNGFQYIFSGNPLFYLFWGLYTWLSLVPVEYTSSEHIVFGLTNLQKCFDLGESPAIHGPKSGHQITGFVKVHETRDHSFRKAP